MEAAPARELEGRLHNSSTRATDPRFGRGKVGGVDHHERPARWGLFVSPKSTGQPAVCEAGVVRAVIRKLPPEDARIVLFRRGQIGRRKLDIVDPAVVRFVFHRELQYGPALLP